MGIYDLLKLAADWSLAAVLAGVLVWVIKRSDERMESLQQELAGRLAGVVDKNTQALAEIKPALENITRFMDGVERRLAAIEDTLGRLSRREETF
ncbi:MAG: hypothetical protein FJ014_13230 [Chloroflexi bacterium]|nr:hypothetical protein [Chloroflexota bacterium]